MGDRFTWYEDCPKCKGQKTVEVYDAPSCMQFLRKCEKCDWSDDLDYYETSEDTQELLTSEEAKKRGIEWRSGLEIAIDKDPELSKSVKKIVITPEDLELL